MPNFGCSILNPKWQELQCLPSFLQQTFNKVSIAAQETTRKHAVSAFRQMTVRWRKETHNQMRQQAGWKAFNRGGNGSWAAVWGEDKAQAPRRTESLAPLGAVSWLSEPGKHVNSLGLSLLIRKMWVYYLHHRITLKLEWGNIRNAECLMGLPQWLSR